MISFYISGCIFALIAGLIYCYIDNNELTVISVIGCVLLAFASYALIILLIIATINDSLPCDNAIRKFLEKRIL